MISRLLNFTPNGFLKKYIKLSVIKLLHAKVQFGMSINTDQFLINSFFDNAKQIAA